MQENAMQEKLREISNTNLVEIKQVTKVFRKQKVLNQVSLHIPKNSVYGLLGPKGA